MLSHRTGITRHDTIWYQSDDTRKELFDKLKYLEPKEPLRQIFLYNNMMYAAVGYLIELQSGKTWEEFVRERIFKPLEMTSTVYSIADMLKQPDFGVPYTEKRDTFEIYQIPYYEDIGGVAPCGAIISNIEDMSHWLIALMNDGMYNGKQVLPPDVLKATLEPAIAIPNTAARRAATGSAQRRLRHGAGDGLLPGPPPDLPRRRPARFPLAGLLHAQGQARRHRLRHRRPLRQPLQHGQLQRLRAPPGDGPDALERAPARDPAQGQEGGHRGPGQGRRATASPAPSPPTPWATSPATIEHPAYGILKVEMKDGELHFDFHKIRLPLTHFHYDRFDTPDDESFGRSASTSRPIRRETSTRPSSRSTRPRSSSRARRRPSPPTS